MEEKREDSLHLYVSFNVLRFEDGAARFVA